MCRTRMLPAVLYGSGTWALTLREEDKPKGFENRVLWEIFRSKGRSNRRRVETA